MEDGREMISFMDERPRETLARKGIEALTDKELVMLLVQTGSRYRSLEEISDEVLSTIDRNSSVSQDSLMLIKGLGEAKAGAIAAALEIGRRKNTRKMRKISTPRDVYEEIKHYATRKQEHLLVLALNGAHEVIFSEVVTIGLVNMTVVHPREVFSNAIRERATAVIISHNHPSGVHEDASEEDITITKRIRNAGTILGISLIDHVIISANGYMSFKERGLL